MNIKKKMLRNETYIPNDIEKHEHEYKDKYLLIVTNKNKHASCNYYNTKEHYIVLKCKYCNSFIPDSIPGNYNHHIFYQKDIDKSLPIIKAVTNQKCPHYNFSKLIDVEINQ